MNKNSTGRKGLMESEDDYESCDSSFHLLDGSQFYTNVTPSPSKRSNSGGTYKISEMTRDLLEYYDTDGCCCYHDLKEDNSIDVGVIPQKLENFRKIEDDRKKQITFGEDMATETLSHSMVQEYKMVETALLRTFGVQDIKQLTLNDLVEYFFGPKSTVTELFLETLGVRYSTFLKWINTIFIMETHNMSINLLTHDDGVLDKEVINVSTKALSHD